MAVASKLDISSTIFGIGWQMTTDPNDGWTDGWVVKQEEAYFHSVEWASTRL